jgi:hypothetical protein
VFDAGKADMGLYVVLQKMTDKTFSMPYDNQYFKSKPFAKRGVFISAARWSGNCTKFCKRIYNSGQILDGQNKLDGAIEYYWQALKVDSKMLKLISTWE